MWERFQNYIVLEHCERTCSYSSEHGEVLPSCLVTESEQPQAEVKHKWGAKGVEGNCHGQCTTLYGKTD